MSKIKWFLSLSSVLFLSACVSSVSTKLVKKEGLGNGNEAKGKALLEETWKAQGLDKLQNHENYEAVVNDTWQGFLGKANTPWPEPSMDLNLRYAIRTFEGQVNYLSGSKKDNIEGLQSWKYYALGENSVAKFDEKKGKKLKFILPALQYFMELPDRLMSAELITYAGEKEFNSKKYSLVMATWNKLKAHKQNDQYLLWINKETKLVDYCEFTIHETFSARYFAGSIGYDDYKEVEGVKIPFAQYLFAGGPKVDQSKNLHRVKVSSFKFDSFETSILYPDVDLEKMGDSK